MKRWFLAAALLFLSAGLASADYVIIVANLGGSPDTSTELRTAGAGMAGVAGGQPQAGMMGARGGMPPPGVGMMGGRGGMPPGGMMGARGGMPPPGVGMMGGMGMRGGMMGMGMSGGMMGMMMRGGMMGMLGGTPDIDDVPYFVVAVVEVEPTGGTRTDLYKKLNPQTQARGQIAQAKVKHKWGTCTLLAKTNIAEVFVITKENDRKSLPTVLQRFNEKFSTLSKENASAGLWLELVDWTLEHGLVDKFPQVMDKLVEADKEHPVAVTYRKVKAELDRPPVHDDEAASWRNKLLSGYKVTESPHYAVIHNSATSLDIEVKSHLDLLENAFRGYYYWFTLKGMALPVPKQRLLAVVTSQQKDFKHFQKILTSTPVVVDGFFARRENLTVMASQRQDETYEVLKKYWQNFADKGFRRTELLTGLRGRGYPSQLDKTQPNLVHEARLVALMLKALEQEAELATISHEVSRQLLFSSGLLPRNVAVPEWLMFGLGSFFETPLQSPWAGIGAPSPYYLPRWQELKSKEFEKKREDTLIKVVTDAYFRSLPAEEDKDKDKDKEGSARTAYEHALRKARTAAWSLTYFLTKQKLDALQQYFKELDKMPRDIELDDEVLLGCFARAFGAVDANNKVDKAQLKKLADEWFNYIDKVKFESESTMKQIREIFRKKLAESQSQSLAGQQTQPGGIGGVFPPGGRGAPPGGNRGGGTNPP